MVIVKLAPNSLSRKTFAASTPGNIPYKIYVSDGGGFPLNRLSDHATGSAMKWDFSTVWSRRSSGLVPHRILYVMLGVAIIAAAAVVAPKSTSDPAASPEDRAKEDLSRYEYPSLEGIRWKAHFVRPQDSLERLFGKDWVAVARFNRIDRRHAYPGMTIKIPENMEEIRNYTPMPATYEKARKHRRSISS